MSPISFGENNFRQAVYGVDAGKKLLRCLKAGRADRLWVSPGVRFRYTFTSQVQAATCVSFCAGTAAACGRSITLVGGEGLMLNHALACDSVTILR